MKTAALFLAFSASFALPSPSAAQSTIQSKSVDDVRRDSKFHIGSIYVTPRLELKDFGVDTNIFNEPGVAKKDFTFTLRPGAEIAVPVAHKMMIESKAIVGLAYYQTYASERSLDPDVSVKASYFTPHVTLFAANSFLASRQRPNFEIDRRSRRKQNILSAGFDVHISDRTSVEFSMSKAVIRWAGDALLLSQSLQLNLDRDSVIYRTFLRSKRTAKTTLTLTADVSHDRFRFTSLRNSDIVRFLPGVEFAPRALISGSAQFGFKRFHTLSPTLPSFSGLINKLDLGYTFLGSTRISVSTSRDVDYSRDLQQPYFVANGIGLSIRRQLFGKNDAIIAGQNTRYSYTLDASSPPIADPRETTSSYSLDIGHRMSNTTRMGFGISHIKRDSRLGPGRNFEGWQYGVSFTYGQ